MRHAIATVILAAWVLWASCPAQAGRAALVIGNADYAVSGDLANPLNDATDMATRLSQVGYSLFGGGPHLDLTERQMSTLVRDFANSLQEGDLAVFYYAGHGAQYNGTSYLVPVDDAEIAFANDLRDFAYDAETALQRITAVPGVTAVMILDACRNLPLRRRPTGNRDSGGDAAGLARMQVPAGRSAIVIYATAPNQTSSDGDGRNGTFTGAFLEALDDPARRVDDIHYEAAALVRARTDGFQAPWIELGFAGVTPPVFAQPTRPAAAAGPTGPAGPTPDSALRVVERTWAMIRTIEDPAAQMAAIAGFVETFPEAPAAAAARVRLNDLRATLAAGRGTAPQTRPAAPAKPGRGVLDDGAAHYGAIALAAPPPPGGARFRLLAGGFERAAPLADDCRGYIAAHPDYRLDWTDRLGRLTLAAEGAAGLTLVVRTPDGGWLCGGGPAGPDAGATGATETGAAGTPAAQAGVPAAMPRVDLGDPVAGAYRIWVGTLDQPDTAPTATLVILPHDADGLRREVGRPLPGTGVGPDLPRPEAVP